MISRSVVVVMPFGGDKDQNKHRAILNYKRLEYLVRSKCKVTSVSPLSVRDKVVYAVEIAGTAMDHIPDNALQQIETADILIAVVIGQNLNVIYEVAHRRAREGTVVLVVDSDSNLPLYLRPLAHQNWKQEEVLDRIDRIATDKGRGVSDFTMGIPDDLKATIDTFDSELQMGLQRALQQIEAQFDPMPWAVQHFRQIVSERMSTYYPCSIVEVTFSSGGESADPTRPAIVRDFNNAFSHFYDYANRQAAEDHGPLTLVRLLERIKGYSDPDHWNNFMEDQNEVTNRIVERRGFARAKIPMQINKHPHGEFCGKSFLPCIIAHVMDERSDERHKMYLLVVYIELHDTLRSDKPKRNRTGSHV
ncbi:MAG: hypothetical protein HQK60_15835 [Deltaproteobacteria bacterium]|nr:hypothetical protein [Deltaproteobacteria bacterium]